MGMNQANSTIAFRKAVDGDVEAVAACMRAAFKMWEPIGYDLSALNAETVRSFLLKDGYVAEDERQRIIGSVSINFTRPRVDGREMHVSRAHRTDTTALLEPSQSEFLSRNTFAYFYSLAVDPECAKMGLGKKCLGFVEDEAARHGCRGILLETGKRTGWLVEWYERSGFKLIGTFVRGSVPVVFMLKELPPMRAS